MLVFLEPIASSVWVMVRRFASAGRYRIFDLPKRNRAVASYFF